VAAEAPASVIAAFSPPSTIRLAAFPAITDFVGVAASRIAKTKLAHAPAVVAVSVVLTLSATSATSVVAAFLAFAVAVSGPTAAGTVRVIYAG